MTTAKQRITELQKRQVYYGSSMVVKLNAVNGYWFYSIYLWSSQYESDNKSLLQHGEYTGQDPEELIKEVESIIGKRKLGVPITNPRSSIT